MRKKAVVAAAKLLPVLLVVVLSALFFDFFYNSYNSTRGFVANNYSNPITAEAPTTVYFKVSQPRLRQIEAPIVGTNGETAPGGTLTVALYNAQNQLLQSETLSPKMLEELGSTYTLVPRQPLQRGQVYSLVFTSTARQQAGAYRLSIGAAESSDVQQWEWAGLQEEATPNISFIYYSFARLDFLLVLGCVLAALAAVLLPPLPKKWMKTAYHIGLALLAPLPVLYATEALNMGGLASMPLRAIVLNYLLMLCLYVVLYALTARFSAAVAGASGVILLGGVVNYFVLAFRQTVVLPTDVYGLGTAVNVLGGYRLFFSYPLLLALAVWGMLFCLALRDVVVYSGLRRRAVSAAVAMAYTLGMALVIATPGAYTSENVWLDVYRQTQRSKTNGLYLNFAMNLPYMANKKPQGYSAAALQQLALATEGFAASPAPQTDEEPYVVVIMNESFADFSIAGDTGASADPLPFLHSLAQSSAANVFVGNVVVPVYGGNTNCSEFEMLTGFSLTFVNSSNAPFSQFVVRETPSLASAMG